MIPEILLPDSGSDGANASALASPVATSWILTDGNVGTMNQCLGLADALGLAPEIKLMRPRALWRALPQAWWPLPLQAQATDADPITAPWPDLLIVSGRVAFAPGAAIGKASRGRTLTVAIQHPRMRLERFDLVIVPRHDQLDGSNVLVTEGAMNRISQAQLDRAELPEAMRVPTGAPRVAVLLGGDNRVYRFTGDDGARLGAALARLIDAGAAVMVTPSRRTGASALAAIKAALGRRPAYIWDQTGANPYFAMLARADHILVTPDSISMISEAATTGKPVHILEMTGGGGKFDTFLARMEARGAIRRFDGRLDHWHYPPLDDTERAADRVRQMLAAR